MANHVLDQAASLRQLLQPRLARMVCITSLRPQAGLTDLSFNLGHALSQLGQNVLLLDAAGRQQHGMAERYLSPPWQRLTADLQQPLSRCVHERDQGLWMLPVGETSTATAETPTLERLHQEFVELTQPMDWVLLHSGCEPTHSMHQSLLAHDVLLLIGPNPHDLTEAYARIKRLHVDYHKQHFWLLVNQVADLDNARSIHQRLDQVTRRYLDLGIKLLGFIPWDDWLSRASRMGEPVRQFKPEAESNIAFDQLARAMLRWPALDAIRPAPLELMRHMLHLPYPSQSLQPKQKRA